MLWRLQKYFSKIALATIANIKKGATFATLFKGKAKF